MSKEDFVKIFRAYEDEYCKEITAHWKSVTTSKKDGSDYFQQLLQNNYGKMYKENHEFRKKRQINVMTRNGGVQYYTVIICSKTVIFVSHNDP